MILTFELRFHSVWGQRLFISGDHPLFGSGDIKLALPLRYKDASRWDVVVWVPDGQAPSEELSYDYVLQQPDGTLIRDWGVSRKLNLAQFKGRGIVITDSWNYAGFYENSFYTEPFQQVLLKNRQTRFSPIPVRNPTHRFSVGAPLLGKDETLCLVGSAPSLGAWNTDAPVLMARSARDPDISVDVRLSPEDFPLEYKYGVFNLAQGKFVQFESGANRLLPDAPGDGHFGLVRDAFAVLPSTTWKGAGVSIPVFSLRSERSFGIGEFRDLQLLADWCAATGLKLIQVLPVNDTTATKTRKDSYPYSAISAFALNPVYLCLEQVASLPETHTALRGLEPERQRLNSLPAVDYEAVLRAKLGFLRTVFPVEKHKVFHGGEYLAFYRDNRSWLLPYAVFCGLRDKFNTSDFTKWPSGRCLHEAEIKKLASGELRDEVELACFTQFHLHRQLQAAAHYAHERGIILKGDIPIGVFRCGADAWQQPEQFNMAMQSGAPPDAFAVKGQNWEFPTYNWQRMEQDGYSWWKLRFTQMGRYFDAFRIDHILGFFRIWSVPRHAVQGILGFFVPALAVRREEFDARGIPFDHDRFVNPRITDRSLNERFGPETSMVIDTFLEPAGPGNYRLREEFKTQRQAQQFFAGRVLSPREPDERSLALRDRLLDMIADVLLLEEQGNPGAFHFRFSIEATTAFKEMSPEAQAKVKDLYVDYFYRRQEDFWMREGLKRLPALKRATSMLICGEDLGMVPACVPKVLRDLGLLSLEIQRMPKDPSVQFFRPAQAPYLSVVSPSSHDMSTIRGWWEEDRPVTQRFYNEELRLEGAAPLQCTPEINALIVRQHLDSPAMWSIFQLQDLLGSDETLRRPDPREERINVPANPDNVWCFRMHLSLEQLLSAHAFNQRLRQAIAAGGRDAGDR